MKTREWINIVGNTPPHKRTRPSDYHYLFCKGMVKEEREKYSIGDIWINAAVCLECKDYIRSTNGHNFKTCSCGNISVDGGSWYSRRVFKDQSKYIDIIEYFYN